MTSTFLPTSDLRRSCGIFSILYMSPLAGTDPDVPVVAVGAPDLDVLLTHEDCAYCEIQVAVDLAKQTIVNLPCV